MLMFCSFCFQSRTSGKQLPIVCLYRSSSIQFWCFVPYIFQGPPDDGGKAFTSGVSKMSRFLVPAALVATFQANFVFTAGYLWLVGHSFCFSTYILIQVEKVCDLFIRYICYMRRTTEWKYPSRKVRSIKQFRKAHAAFNTHTKTGPRCL